MCKQKSPRWRESGFRRGSLIQVCLIAFFNKLFMPNKKKISVFQVTGLKILGRVGTHIFLNIFFLNFFLCVLKGEMPKYNFMPFKINEIIFFPENLKNF